jgi:hypothetical protein
MVSSELLTSSSSTILLKASIFEEGSCCGTHSGKRKTSILLNEQEGSVPYTKELDNTIMYKTMTKAIKFTEKHI